MKVKLWGSMFRNRRGAVCVVCCSLAFVVAVLFGTWSSCCLHDWKLQPLPDGTLPALALFLGSQCFKYRDDRIAERDKPPAPAPTPAS